MPKQIFMPKEKSANVAQYRQVIMAMKRAKASLMVCFLHSYLVVILRLKIMWFADSIGKSVTMCLGAHL